MFAEHTCILAHYTLTLMCFTELLLACTEVNWKLIFEGKRKLTSASQTLGELCRLKPVVRLLSTGNRGEMDHF